jgi:hypothetical protein
MSLRGKSKKAQQHLSHTARPKVHQGLHLGDLIWEWNLGDALRLPVSRPGWPSREFFEHERDTFSYSQALSYF